MKYLNNLKGDAFRKARTNGNVVKPWNISVKVNIGSNSVSLTDNISVTVNYNGYEETILDKYTDAFDNATEFTRQVGGILKDKFFLDNKNHFFMTEFCAGNYDKKNRDINYFRIKYSYIVTNRLKYNDTHEFKMNLTKTYKSVV